MRTGNPKVVAPDAASTSLYRALVQLRITRDRLERAGAASLLAEIDAVRAAAARIMSTVRDRDL